MVILCFNDETIEVPQAAVKTLLEQGATCGSCDNRCCPSEMGEKIDMCLNGNTINVSRNACQGILNAGGTCGACENGNGEIELEPEPEIDKEEIVSKSKSVIKKTASKITAKE
ncbi:MAG: hypothetical protein V3W20_10660 [Candidatus Neomarinimicrobiota bacterium]